ncbi:MAG: anthranilate phosphoribosyltransferase [bacterium]|nr:anthranilate phosphoribosyltransferase [bacterium]
MIQAEEILNKLVEKKDLTVAEARAFLNGVGNGISEVQAGSILTALRMKGESSSEIVGLVEEMRRKMLKIKANNAIDIVGTGGDGSGTFNISTAAAFVAAGAGAGVAKHGNRAASSRSGSADVLESMGVNIQLTREQAEEVFQKAGMVFLSAPMFHPAMKDIVAVRKALKIRTIFNILGPFANPAGTRRQLVGVPNADIAKKMAKAATKLGYTRLLIVTSEDGMDEVSLSAKTRAYEVRGKSLRTFIIDPKKYGFKKSAKRDILGGSAEENAAILREILDGKKGARRDIVVLNAGFALVVAGLARNAREGIQRAEESIDSGKALKVLENLIKETQKFRNML